MRELHRDGEISAEDYLDSGLAVDLRETVRNELEAELTGGESNKEVRELAREVVDDELE